MKKVLLILFFLSTLLFSKELHYDLTIDYQNVNFTGKNVKVMTINGNIPGPTIKATEGDWVTINVKNKMDVDTSIHWHGILFPGRNDQDSVPNLTTPPIKAHSSLTFRLPFIQVRNVLVSLSHRLTGTKRCIWIHHDTTQKETLYSRQRIGCCTLRLDK